MSIGKTRGFLYTLARLMGDVNAVKKGKVSKRVARRVADKRLWDAHLASSLSEGIEFTLASPAFHPYLDSSIVILLL